VQEEKIRQVRMMKGGLFGGEEKEWEKKRTYIIFSHGIPIYLYYF
jgi:hypothetical protein